MDLGPMVFTFVVVGARIKNRVSDSSTYDPEKKKTHTLNNMYNKHERVLRTEVFGI